MGGRLGGQGGCEWRSEGFVKIKNFIFFFWGGGGGGGGGGGESGWGIRVDGSGEVKHCEKFKKKQVWGVRVDVNGEVKLW